MFYKWNNRADIERNQHPKKCTQQSSYNTNQRALDNKIKVLIVGNLVPANYGATLNKELSNMYLQVARKHKVSLVPFMLKGVADVPNASRLFQADQLHPLAVAHPTILSNIWPELRKLL